MKIPLWAGAGADVGGLRGAVGGGDGGGDTKIGLLLYASSTECMLPGQGGPLLLSFQVVYLADLQVSLRPAIVWLDMIEAGVAREKENAGKLEAQNNDSLLEQRIDAREG